MGATIRIIRNEGRKIPTVEAKEPQRPSMSEPVNRAPTRKPTKVAVITTGPGLIMPIATATRNSRSLSQPVC